MSNDPLGGGGSKTVFQPSPLQQRQTPPPPAGGPVPPPAPVDVRPDDVPEPGVPIGVRNPVAAACHPFLAAAARVRASRTPPDLDAVRAYATEELAQVRRDLRALNVSGEHEQRILYALAATMDDIAQNLPGPAAADWARRPLVVATFGEAIGGERFWELLNAMIDAPAENADVLEVYHAALAAGFEGKYRVAPDGQRALSDTMARILAALGHAGRAAPSGDLSPRWRGEPTPVRHVGLWTPILIGVIAAAVLAVLIYAGFRISVARESAAVARELSSITPREPILLARGRTPVLAPPPPRDTTQSERLETLLQPQIQAGEVEVALTANRVVVRTTVGNLFRSGSDRVNARYAPMFQAVAQALDGEVGDIMIVGHTDSDSISTVQFPSNYDLSRSRAIAGQRMMERHLSAPGRITRVEGVADTQPVADNATSEGKARNRRLEISVPRRG